MATAQTGNTRLSESELLPLSIKHVTIAENVLDPESWQTFTTEGAISPILLAQWDKFPDTARIYHNQVADSHDVTPHTEEEVLRLDELEGDFWVVVYPELPIPILIIIAIALAAVSIGLSFLLRPNTKATQQSASPNNSLSDRQNQARPNERIPDIFGTVRSTPDLIQQPYKIFQNNIEIEHSYMCIGRGYYTIIDCKDDVTNIGDIDGAYAAVFAPGTSPNSATPTPQETFGAVGTGVTIPKIVSIQPSSAIVGQVMRAPNSGNLNTVNNVGFVYPDQIVNDGSFSFLDYFAVGTMSNPNYLIADANTTASDPGGSVHSVHLDGIYEILAVTDSTITLSSPGSVNSNWSVVGTFTGAQSTFAHQFNLSTTGSQWVGTYDLQIADLTEVWCNFVAPQGLYYINGDGNQKELDVTLEIGVQSIDVVGTPVGDEIFGTVNVIGSTVVKNQRGATIKFVLPAPGPVRVRAVRSTPIGTSKGNQYVEEIQWRDLYAVSAVAATDFGDVTTVQTITIPTQDALSVKQRKLNMLVTRNLPTWNNRATGTGHTPFTLAAGQTAPTFSTTLYPTNNAADIICAMALDSAIGRRTIAEINVQQIYATADSTEIGAPTGHEAGAIQTYFGTALMTEFCYTFDDSNVSFEESLNDVCQAIGCTAYRQGSQLFLNFEKQTSDATLLFNHRNTLPDSQTRTVSFGTLNDNDGITLNFINPDAPNYPNVDTTQSLYFPPDQSAQNPKQITSVGIRNLPQALIIGWRYYQKLTNQNTQVSMTTLAETAMIPQMSSIMIADNTRPDVQDGEVVLVTGLAVITSQPVLFAVGVTYTAFLQLADGTIQAIACTAGTPALDSRQGSIVLASAPRIALVFDPNLAMRTTYLIVGSTDSAATQFLLQEKQAQENNTYKTTAINYSDKYYLHDQDVVTAAIVPPLFGYATQGFTGSGNLTPALTAYSGPSVSGYNATTYNGSSLHTSNNVPSGTNHGTSLGGVYAPDLPILATDISGLASVATTGTYSSLTGTPTIPASQVNSDWSASSGVAQVLNKPTTLTVPVVTTSGAPSGSTTTNSLRFDPATNTLYAYNGTTWVKTVLT